MTPPLMIGLLAGCAPSIVYGGGSMTVVLDDTAHSGVTLAGTVPGLPESVLVPGADVYAPFVESGSTDGAAPDLERRWDPIRNQAHQSVPPP